MPIRRNGYFNNPQFAQAAANLTSLFAPPSGADAANWANAGAARQEAARLAQFFKTVQDPNTDWSTIDRMGVGAGVFPPNQSFEAVDRNNATQRYGYDRTYAASTENNIRDNARALEEQAMIEAAAMDRLGVTDATERRGQDITANTTLATNRLDNQRSAITDLYAPLDQGQIRPAVPDELMEAIGLPGVGSVAGADKPLSEDEVTAEIIRTLDPSMQQAIAFGDTPIEAVVTPDGPRNATRLDAVGQEPFFEPSQQAKPTNGEYNRPDGTRGPAVQDPQGFWRDAQTGERLPEDVRITSMPQPQGSQDDLGITTAGQTDIDRKFMANARVVDLGNEVMRLAEENPGAVGVAGWAQRTAQNLAQTLTETGQAFGGQAMTATEAMRRGMMDEGVANEYFNPGLPELDSAFNELIWAYASAQQGDGRVSNQQMEETRRSLGIDGPLATNAQFTAAVKRLVDRASDQMQTQRPLVSPGIVNNYGQQTPATQSPTAEQPADTGGQRLRFNPATGRIE